ncbi:tyrosinase family oxidase copper chaperone [Streptomyces longispororuber]|uniref:tyrosinase family oxidase copper chaperone n=1 Tax=Streptomyces longispororuber TaxID=68230 RepID=UPI0036FA1D40
MTSGAGTPLTHRVGRRHLLGVAAVATLTSLGVLRGAYTRRKPGRTDRARPAPEEGAFEEMYRGRHIQGVPLAPGDGRAPGDWHVTVDGRRLGVMRRADGSYLSMVDHYASYGTPRAAARGAVDELGAGEALRGHTH